MAAPSAKRRARYSVRPFFISTFIITVLATYALFIRGPVSDTSSDAPYLGPRSKTAEPDCNTVHDVKDQCAFVRRYCHDDEAGIIQYLAFYYCTLGSVKPIAFILMVVWLGLLFATIGIAASDFFSVNLSTIASILGLSESLAGVTFLAFGNGSPDVFSTFAAMGSNSGSMAVGELIGAAGFISAVVAGSMALVREFKVSKRTFVRDICFFIVAVGFAIGFLADGHLKLWECLTMIAFYLIYVVTVVGWHWIATRRKQKRLKDSTARSHVFAPTSHAADELEPYRDEGDEDDTGPVGGSRGIPQAVDISALERAPLIEVDRASPIEEDDERGVHIAAEMTSSMRVNRPRWGRSNTTITPTRPSLVGALEFRSILASLQRERNMRLTPLPPRDYFDTSRGSSPSLDHLRQRGSTGALRPPVSSTARDRALSSGQTPLNLGSMRLPQPNFPVDTSSTLESPAHGQSPMRPIAGAVTPSDEHALGEATPQLQPASRGDNGGSLQLQIPSPPGRSSGHSSPSLSPFPDLSESPLPTSPNIQAQPSSFAVPNTTGARHSPHIMHIEEQGDSPRPVKWWPYTVLPPPHILLGTLFPTLLGWNDKSIWDKAVSAASVPSIFLLVVTLPVVETDHDDLESNLTDVPTPLGGPASEPTAISSQEDVPIEPETIWEHYRLRTRSFNSRASLSPSPGIPSHHHAAAPPSQGSVNANRPDPVAFSSLPEPAKPTAPSARDAAPSIAASSSPDSPEWQRWLVALQLFTGPLFVVLILWANIYEDLSQPSRTLARMVLYSLLGSTVALGVLLLTTSPSTKPRYHSLLCFLGFIISIAWISTVAGEVVGVLKALGVILGISEAILGLTVFAVGNSLGDLVADVTVARLGYPVMALAACFGGPMLNILLGVGVGGAWMIIKSANEKHRKHPEQPTVYRPYKIEVGETLLISAVTVLLTLMALLVAVPLNKWHMSRRIGWGLIALWTAGTVVNVVVEVTGPWSEVA